MSSYLQANQPYQRVDDGIGAGLVTGGMLGAGASFGAFAAASGKGMKNLERSGVDMSARLSDLTSDVSSGGIRNAIKEGRRISNTIGNETIGALGNGKKGKAAKFAFGSGKRRAITAGASVLGMSLLGAGIDGSNN